MKKLLISFSIVFITLFMVTSVMGAKPHPPVELPAHIEEKINIYVVLEDLETGEKVFLEPNLIQFHASPMKSSSSEQSFEITYEVGIPKEMVGGHPGGVKGQSFLFPSAVHANESKYLCDSTSSACATLTFYYSEGRTNGVDYMYMNKVTNKWTRLDSQVSWSGARIKGRCYAEWFSGSGMCNATHTGNVSNPNSGSTYSVTPWFSGSGYKTVVDDLSNFQVASQEITLHRGGSNWNFSLCIVNGGGGTVYGCY